MIKRDYLLAALNYGSYLYKGWVIDAFGIVQYPAKDEERRPGGKYPLYFKDEPKRQDFEEYPYQLFVEDDQIVFFDPVRKEWDVLQGAEVHKAPFQFKQTIDLKAGDLVNVKENITTLVGNVLVNQTVLCHSFGDRISFVTGQIKMGKIEDKIAALLQSPPDDPNDRDPKAIYTDELEKRYYPAAYSITGWCQLAAPAATPYTIVTAPDMAERRKALYEQYKDQLDNPAIVAKIMAELIKYDIEFQSQDPEKGFLRPGSKDFDVVRAKAYISHAVEYDFENRNKITVIQNPLSEQWDITKLPEMANSLIDGSFNRGAVTALGGEAAKFIGRFFLNTKITEDDCGSKLGIKHTVTKNNESDFHWAYYFNDKNELSLMTPEVAAAVHGRTFIFRSPQFCHTENGNFCVKCMGKRFDGSRNALGALATEVGNILMSISMSKMHGAALKTTRWNWKRALK